MLAAVVKTARFNSSDSVSGILLATASEDPVSLVYDLAKELSHVDELFDLDRIGPNRRFHS